jgi:transposase
MAGKSPVMATDAQCAVLKAMAAGAERGPADRARAILLTLGGWTSARIAEAFGVREDTVRLWRSDFMASGVEALAASVATGPATVKAAAALRVAGPLLEAPVADRPNWTLARLAEEIKAQEGVSISRSQLSKVLRKKGGSASGGHGTR